MAVEKKENEWRKQKWILFEFNDKGSMAFSRSDHYMHAKGMAWIWSGSGIDDSILSRCSFCACRGVTDIHARTVVL